MATITKTWSFNSDTQGWVATLDSLSSGGGLISAQWQVGDTTTGDPGGCLEMTQAGSNAQSISHVNYWELTGTWEALFGIPAGSTVTQIGTVDDYDWRAPTFTLAAAGNQTGPFELRNNAGVLQATLSSAVSVLTTSNWVTTTGTSQSVPAGIQSSSATIKLRLTNTLSVQKNNGAQVILRQDKITVTITYTSPPPPPPGLPFPILGPPLFGAPWGLKGGIWIPWASNTSSSTLPTQVTWYFLPDKTVNVIKSIGTISENPPNQMLNTSGWLPGNLIAPYSAEYFRNTVRQTTDFSLSAKPDGTIDAIGGDCMRTERRYTGTFIAGNWQIVLAMHANKIPFSVNLIWRLFRSPDLQGLGATEITSGPVASFTFTGQDQTINSPWFFNPITVNREYIFFKLALQVQNQDGVGDEQWNLYQGGLMGGTAAGIIPTLFIGTSEPAENFQSMPYIFQGGPDVPGAPWNRARKTWIWESPPPPAPPPIPYPLVFTGPGLSGAPWKSPLVGPAPISTHVIVPPPPPPPPGASIGYAYVLSGPIRGPWITVTPIVTGLAPPAFPPVIPPGKWIPTPADTLLIPFAPQDTDNRLERHTLIVSKLLNSLLRTGQIVMAGSDSFFIQRGGAFTIVGVPSAIHDRNAGFQAGSFWLDTSTGILWVSVKDSIGAAVWRQVNLT